MIQKKYLIENEVNEGARKYIDFSNQAIKNNSLYVKVYCSICEEFRMIKVAIIRYRKNIFTGVCQSCAKPATRDAKLLLESDIRDDIKQYIDLSNQKLLPQEKNGRSLNALRVQVTCKLCKTQRWVLVSSIRHHFDTFTTLCRKCSNKGEYNPNWGGGKTIKYGEGYLAVKIFDAHPDFEMIKSMIRTDNTILEHRLVMAQKIGRALERYEEVHHINSNRLDNRPENLELVDRKSHHLITVADTELRKLRKENEILKAKVKILETKLKD